MRCNTPLRLPQDKQMFCHLELLESAKAEWECFTVKNTDCRSHFKSPYVCGNSSQHPSLLLWHCRHSALIKIHLVGTHVGTPRARLRQLWLSKFISAFNQQVWQSAAENRNLNDVMERFIVDRNLVCGMNGKTFTIQRHTFACSPWSSILMRWII